jgi:hypothetical protein
MASVFGNTPNRNCRDLQRVDNQHSCHLLSELLKLLWSPSQSLKMAYEQGGCHAFSLTLIADDVGAPY